MDPCPGAKSFPLPLNSPALRPSLSGTSLAEAPRMTRSLWLVAVGSAIAIGATALLACAAKPLADDSAGPKTGGSAIPAEDIGGHCEAGLGGTPGTIIGIPLDSCPGGACVIDLRSVKGRLEDQLYCTADCDGHTCPSGTS